MRKLIVILLSLALMLGLSACNSVNVGNIIKFGSYDWRVLDVQDDKALIISEDIIELKSYHADGGEITWEHSSIRQYLNGEFYNSFPPAEQGRIVETIIINCGNSIYGAAGGNDTTDNIFLLDFEEAQIYFTDDASRIAVDADGEGGWWWLRSPGYDSIDAACVYYNGGIGTSGYVGFIGGVRPAMWISLE
ncbi:MAG: DUF6273 domain-containing protein [Oscillospiraceae bacterium]|nr:DUF6273 domain-containing protein [Oscillospiraceae bacterium]